ncbi:hypothetical protein EDB89DRAFT_1904207 [Lactarius sanguifluus]|nr:hypothetical protein EDB89DRAFT_1904207 [Lactarius sanguifluus]
MAVTGRHRCVWDRTRVGVVVDVVVLNVERGKPPQEATFSTRSFADAASSCMNSSRHPAAATTTTPATAMGRGDDGDGTTTGQCPLPIDHDNWAMPVDHHLDARVNTNRLRQRGKRPSTCESGAMANNRDNQGDDHDEPMTERRDTPAMGSDSGTDTDCERCSGD